VSLRIARLIGFLCLSMSCRGATDSSSNVRPEARAVSASVVVRSERARVPYTIVLLGDASCEGPRTAVVRDSVVWKPLWHCATATVFPPEAPPRLDFRRELYLFVAPAAYGGPSSLTIDSLNVRRDTLVLSATHDLTDACSGLAMVSKVAAIVRTHAWPGAVRFDVTRVKRPCGS
jgi:hypothetical protein